jgi:hypothetical protein
MVGDDDCDGARGSAAWRPRTRETSQSVAGGPGATRQTVTGMGEGK